MKKNKKKADLTPRLELSTGAVSWLMLVFLVVISWHIPHTPIWALVAIPLLLGWKYRMMVKKQPLPSKAIRYTLTVLAFAGVIVTYNSFLGRDPGITAVILLTIMKMLELKNQRDFMFVVFLCYFLVFGNFLYAQSIPNLAFMIVAVVLVTAVILRFNHGDDPHFPVKPRFILKKASRFFLVSIPFMVVLFFLFPRTTGPLWNLPQGGAKKGQSGFSESVSMGQVASLAESNKTAFRVVFPDANMPMRKDLYFRGLVLWFTDGKEWHQGILPSRTYQKPQMGDGGIRHNVTLEPHRMRWAFGLDTPIRTPRGSRELPGSTFQAWNRITRHVSYNLVSTLKPLYDEELYPLYRRWALQLPKTRNPRLTELARSFREGAETDTQVVQACLDYYVNNGFIYTLAPGDLNPERPMEDFLFNVRQGFCEYYSSTFTYLMREAGIPARMIVGYQGGEFNPAGDYLVIRQSDAHAWAEVWLDGEGWRRVDPTTMVSPERLEFGAELSRTIAEIAKQGGNRSDAIQRATRRNYFKRIKRFFEQHWDNINNKWELWILTYDRYKQRDILKGVGLSGMNSLSLLIILVFVIPTIFYIISILLKRQAGALAPLVRIYRKFIRRLVNKGFESHIWEGPVDLQVRAVEAFPAKGEEIREITGLFIRLRYGKEAVSKKSLAKFKQLVNNFKIPGK